MTTTEQALIGMLKRAIASAQELADAGDLDPKDEWVSEAEALLVSIEKGEQ